jgi:hypothetical protein
MAKQGAKRNHHLKELTSAAGSRLVKVAGCQRVRRQHTRYLYYSLYSQGLNSSAVLCSISDVFLVATIQL